MTANQSLSRPDAPSATETAPQGKRSRSVDSTTSTGTPAPTPTVDVTEILDLLADEYVCAILRSLDDEPMAARELAEDCDISRATVYRRLDRLTASGIVESEMSVARDGHHRQQFRLVVDELEISIGSEGLDGAVQVAPTPTGAAD